MDSAWISAFSAVMGSLVGAFTSFVTTYANQRAQYRRDFLSRQFAQRENLYAEFINEAARLMADSLEQEMVKPSAFVAIYGLENRIRLTRRRSRELSHLRSDKLSQRVVASGVGSYSGV
jgi:hypothetical protein